jgi:ankyrin repeat protein
MKEDDAKLQAASFCGDNISVKELLAAGASVHAVDCSHKTALAYASRRFFAGNFKETALETSMRVDVVEALVKAGADVNFRFYGRSTPLIEAASGFNAFGSDVVEALLKCGADVNLQDDSGMTALMSTICRFSEMSEMYGDDEPPTTDIEDALLKAGADVNLQDTVGKTALMYAARFYYGTGTTVVPALLKAGAEVGHQDHKGQTALHEAAENEDEEAGRFIMEALLKAGADADQQDYSGRTALMYASSRGSLKRVQCLVETGGANVAFVADNGQTASDMATSEAVTTYLHEHPPSLSQNVAAVWGNTVTDHPFRALVIFVCVLTSVVVVVRFASNRCSRGRGPEDSSTDSEALLE